MNRRQFLLLTTGGLLVAAGTSLGYRVTREPGSALAPWQQAGSLYTEPRERALSYAILAPNPHNRQPWLVDLGTPDEVRLFVDIDRMLPHTDPLDRQITIGLGCFLELMVMAAAEDGYQVELSLFPDGEPETALDARPVARARFRKVAEITVDPLFEHVLTRRSTKIPYDTSRPVDKRILDDLGTAAHHGSQVSASNEADSITQLRQLTHDALAIEMQTPRTYRESVELFRTGYRQVDASPDGIALTGPLMEALDITGQLSRDKLLDMNGSAYRMGLDSQLAMTDSAMAHLWVVSDGNGRGHQIDSGRDWVRINLAATAAGLAIQPLSQALQEYPEMSILYEKVHQRLAPQGGTVQMLARLGYADKVSPAPRWPLDQKIISHEQKTHIQDGT